MTAWVPGTVLLAAACLLYAGCAGPGPRSAPTPETPAALARPEPDPACHGTVQSSLATTGLETVTVRLALDASGRAELLDVLSPAVTPAAKAELGRAFSSCAWAPRPRDGQVETFTTTWVRERVGR